MRASTEHNTYRVWLFAESQNGGPCNWPLCVQHHPLLGDRLWGWGLSRAPHWHLHKRVDHVIEFHREALQTFLYFPEGQTNRRDAIYNFFFCFHSSTPFLWIQAQTPLDSKAYLTYPHTPPSKCYLHCSTLSPWAPLLKGLLLLQPASRLILEQLFPWADIRDKQNISMCVLRSPRAEQHVFILLSRREGTSYDYIYFWFH